MKKHTFILSGGGTGGHIYPAIAIADELKRRFPDCSILFVGAKDRMEMQKVPKAGYPIVGLWISGIQRKLSLKNLLFPVKLMQSMIKSKKILKQHQPNVVIGTGGYASAPLLKMASKKGIPSLIQEQNSYAGIANKWLSKDTNTICVAYENMERFFPKEKTVYTGNPVRKDIENLKQKRTQAIEHFQLDETKQTVLVLGGSLGAKKINELIEKSMPFFETLNVQLLWQCGSIYIDKYQKYNDHQNVTVVDFLYQMDLAYAASDFVISRSGALSVSELCLVGKPTLFIPSPNVAEDHQKKNAQAIADKNGALFIEEHALEESFETEFSKLFSSEELQKELSKNIKKMAKPNATKAIVDEIEKLLK